MQIPSLGREDPLREHGNPLQYSCLENPMDRGAWQDPVLRVSKTWTQLSNACITQAISPSPGCCLRLRAPRSVDSATAERAKK